MGDEVTPPNILIIAEDRAHAETVRIWTTTYVREKIDWIRDGGYERSHVESIIGKWPAGFLSYVRVRERAWGQGPRRLPRSQDSSNGSRSGAQRTLFENALLAACDHEIAPEIVFICRDLDGPLDRSGAEAALRNVGQYLDGVKCKVVFAIAAPEVEAWHVAVWKPPAAANQSQHRLACEEAGFDPVREPHRLSSSPAAKAETKKIARLLDTDSTWRAATAAELDSVTSPIGLKEFLEDVRASIFPSYEGGATNG